MGFSLIEMVVLAIIATMLFIAAPRYFRASGDAREAIDHYHGDWEIHP